jgi:biotin carboxyl carrier protein
MSLTKILTIVFLLGSLYLSYVLYNGIDSVIAEREIIKGKETQMKERLMLIREAEIVFQEQMGRYTSNWDSLANFIENGKVPIVQITEKIEQQAYGAEKVTQIFDTIGFIPAKERIFKKNFTMTAPDDGSFQSFAVKVGDQVIKSQKAFTIKSSATGAEQSPKFIENGTIASLADVKAGDEVKKGQILINFWDYRFNPNVEISKIGEVPYEPGTMLTIFTDKVNKSGLIVDVIEVVDPKPADRSRKEDAENKARRPLRFGSRLDAATTGNWED